MLGAYAHGLPLDRRGDDRKAGSRGVRPLRDRGVRPIECRPRRRGRPGRGDDAGGRGTDRPRRLHRLAATPAPPAAAALAGLGTGLDRVRHQADAGAQSLRATKRLPPARRARLPANGALVATAPLAGAARRRRRTAPSCGRVGRQRRRSAALNAAELKAQLAMIEQDDKLAWRELVPLWGIDPGTLDPCTAAARQQVRCSKFVGTMALLKNLARPGVVSLRLRERAHGERRPGARPRPDHGDAARRRADAGRERVPRFANVWRGDFGTLWRVPPGDRHGDRHGRIGPGRRPARPPSWRGSTTSPRPKRRRRWMLRCATASRASRRRADLAPTAEPARPPSCSSTASPASTSPTSPATPRRLRSPTRATPCRTSSMPCAAPTPNVSAAWCPGCSRSSNAVDEDDAAAPRSRWLLWAVVELAVAARAAGVDHAGGRRAAAARGQGSVAPATVLPTPRRRQRPRRHRAGDREGPAPPPAAPTAAALPPWRRRRPAGAPDRRSDAAPTVRMTSRAARASRRHRSRSRGPARGQRRRPSTPKPSFPKTCAATCRGS